MADKKTAKEIMAEADREVEKETQASLRRIFGK